MEVKLLSYTPNALQIMYTAARTCYSKETPIQIWEEFEEGKATRLLNKVLGSGHLSIAEAVNFTFALCGISRSCANQLVRHRHASFAQQSTRYVEFNVEAEKLDRLFSLSGLDSYDLSFLEEYFVIDRKKITYDEVMSLAESLKGYLNCIKQGQPAEEARELLPLCLKTNLVLTCNLRELAHICELRLCTRSQKPIRELVKEMANQVVEVLPFASPYLVAKCEKTGFCDEENSCHRRPKITEILEKIS